MTQPRQGVLETLLAATSLTDPPCRESAATLRPFAADEIRGAISHRRATNRGPAHSRDYGRVVKGPATMKHMHNAVLRIMITVMLRLAKVHTPSVSGW